ncbi:protein kinase [Tolypothrix sp. NIES-4075]|uniref:serine/threonine-protein kinase n=1 Tax=Tolypothrix sp. NIES-4075 TaxID=2005459 RepID=UPI000B5CE5A6|nr:serine/threonine-protein kinase [Tolypothrix sp. NIES-4075]GAX41173.1 protein kinase [Tolypothrix sp. NIES-4075]
MICCLNAVCHNPPNPDDAKVCSHCGVPLITLRHYRPIRVLGSGGFGKTYLAEDVEKFNEQCVIKQFAPQAQGTKALEKATELFEQEARRLQQLGEHPQIPTLFAYFEQENRLYLVQQFIEGDNLLDELKQQGALNEQKIREFLLDLLDILKSVHQQKVIHRDIKPQNIIRRQSDRKLILIDFGASKQLTQTVVTPGEGTTIGSFGYAPPEQMQDGEAYPASDLYSLGATCFHLLTAVTPWQLWKLQGYGWVANWRSRLKLPVTQEFAVILDKLLQPNYQQRYQSAEAVLEDLNSLPSLLDPPATATFYNQSVPTVTFHSQPSPLPVEIPPTVTFHSQPSTLPVEIPPTATFHSQPSPLPVEIPATAPLDRQPSPLPVEIPATAPLDRQPSPLPVEIPATAPLDRQPSLPQTLVSFKDKRKLKQPLLVGAAILFLGLGGYGVWQITNHLPGKVAAYDKLALANSLTGHNDLVSSLAISPDGKTLVSGSGDRTIKIWNLQTSGLKTTLSLHTDGVTSVAISPDGQTLVSASKDGTIKIWNLETGALKNTLTGHKYAVNSIAISPDGQSLASASSDQTIKIWNLQTGALKNTLSGHTKSVWRVVFSPDGQTLASSSYDNTIKLWNLKLPSLKATLTGHNDLVYSLAISPDGQTLVSGSIDKTIKIWNLETGALKNTLNWHKYGVTSVAISPDGKTLVSGSFDNTLKIWNLQTGELQNTLTGHNDLVYAVAISQDGQTLVSGSADKTIKIWRMP